MQVNVDFFLFSGIFNKNRIGDNLWYDMMLTTKLLIPLSAINFKPYENKFLPNINHDHGVF